MIIGEAIFAEPTFAGPVDYIPPARWIEICPIKTDWEVIPAIIYEIKECEDK